MAEAPTCRDCDQQMIAAKGYHAILALQPPDDLDSEQFSPVSLYVCGKCGQIRLYLADLKSWAADKVEVVSYGYRITGQEPEPTPAAAAGKRPGHGEGEPRRSRA